MPNSRNPDLKYSAKMAQKTKTYVLDVKQEDPATNQGIIAIAKVCSQMVQPTIPNLTLFIEVTIYCPTKYEYQYEDLKYVFFRTVFPTFPP